jgi:Outer membrane protein beta-barrel domain
MCRLKLQHLKLYKPGLVAAFLVFSQIGFAQTVSSFGLEVGISFSQFPRHEVNDFINNGFQKIKINPLIGPLIGISKNWILSKYFHLTSGLQYQMAGRRYHYYTRSQNIYDKSDEWKNLTIHKICLPLALGYIFRVGKTKPSIYLGVRPNIWLSAKVLNKYQGYDSHIEIRENLFDKIAAYVDDYKPPKRLLCQFSTGLSSPVGQHLQININFNYGHNYYVATYSPTGAHYTITQETSITSSDYIISIVYYFNRSESKSINNKNE